MASRLSLWHKSRHGKKEGFLSVQTQFITEIYQKHSRHQEVSVRCYGLSEASVKIISSFSFLTSCQWRVKWLMSPKVKNSAEWDSNGLEPQDGLQLLAHLQKMPDVSCAPTMEQLQRRRFSNGVWAPRGRDRSWSKHFPFFLPNSAIRKVTPPLVGRGVNAYAGRPPGQKH